MEFFSFKCSIKTCTNYSMAIIGPFITIFRGIFIKLYFINTNNIKIMNYCIYISKWSRISCCLFTCLSPKTPLTNLLLFHLKKPFPKSPLVLSFTIPFLDTSIVQNLVAISAKALVANWINWLESTLSIFKFPRAIFIYLVSQFLTKFGAPSLNWHPDIFYRWLYDSIISRNFYFCFFFTINWNYWF